MKDITKVEPNFLMREYSKVVSESRKTTKPIDELLVEMGYNDEEIKMLMWVFV